MAAVLEHKPLLLVVRVQPFRNVLKTRRGDSQNLNWDLFVGTASLFLCGKALYIRKHPGHELKNSTYIYICGYAWIQRRSTSIAWLTSEGCGSCVTPDCSFVIKTHKIKQVMT